jgi:NAD(P)-dependent dehydrogenase (short-subunit alcohol dehydrogenase family)
VELGLEGRVCLVTGSTAGIGLATARVLAGEGADVVVCGRNAEAVERARAETGARLGVPCDLSEPNAPAELVRGIEETFGRVDCLVNNVGLAYIRNLDELTDEDWESLWQLNVMSFVRAIRAVIPGMRERGLGRIVNVSSTAGKRPSTGMPNYSVTKAAGSSATRSRPGRPRLPHGSPTAALRIRPASEAERPARRCSKTSRRAAPSAGSPSRRRSPT